MTRLFPVPKQQDKQTICTLDASFIYQTGLFIEGTSSNAYFGFAANFHHVSMA
jgi:hypothetical protein